MSGKRGQSKLAALEIENEHLRSALRVIRTWATVEFAGGHGALNPEDVRYMCAKVLEKEPV